MTHYKDLLDLYILEPYEQLYDSIECIQLGIIGHEIAGVILFQQVPHILRKIVNHLLAQQTWSVPGIDQKLNMLHFQLPGEEVNGLVWPAQRLHPYLFGTILVLKAIFKSPTLPNFAEVVFWNVSQVSLLDVWQISSATFKTGFQLHVKQLLSDLVLRLAWKN